MNECYDLLRMINVYGRASKCISKYPQLLMHKNQSMKSINVQYAKNKLIAIIIICSLTVSSRFEVIWRGVELCLIVALVIFIRSWLTDFVVVFGHF